MSRVPAEPYRGPSEWCHDQERLALALLEDLGRRIHAPGGLGDPAADAEIAREPQGLADLLARLAAPPEPDAVTSAAALDHLHITQQRAAASEPAPPIVALAERLDLSELEVELVRFLFALQTSPEVDRVARALWRDPQPGTGLDLLIVLFGRTRFDRARLTPALAPSGRLRQSRLLVTVVESARFPHVALPESLTAWLAGVEPAFEPPFEAVRSRASVPHELLLTDAVSARLGEASGAPRPRVIFSAAHGAAANVALEALAEGAGCRLVRCDVGAFLRQRSRTFASFEDGLRDAVLMGAWLVLEVPAVWPVDSEWFVDAAAHRLSELPVPVFLLCETPDVHSRRLLPRAERIDAEPLPPEHLATLWVAMSPAQPRPPKPLDLRAVFTDFELQPEAVLAAAPDAAARALRRGAASVGREDLSAACQAQLDVGFADLATRVNASFTWDQLVLPDSVRDQLREILLMCTERNLVMDQWGFGKMLPYGGGVTVLFSGASGTGKTMAASVLATQLERPLYRVDLSRIFDRYVGETEKNLARIFEAARSGHAIVLFDEADALFSKRTEVKSSNDRYANLEVNYLLQRIEQHQGVVILTTNLDSSIDDAFRRRIRHTVRFPNPDAAAREHLWRSMIPAAARVAPSLDLADVADRFELAGGAIKNAVLRAAFLAVGENSPITTEHLERAALAECAALGQLVRR